MKTTKKLMVLLLSMAVAISMLAGMCIVASATGETPVQPWVIADFSKTGIASESDAQDWKSFVSAPEGYLSYHQTQLTGEITRAGKAYSLKWDDHDENTKGNSKLELNTQSGTDNNIDIVLSYDNMGVWMYADADNAQVLSFILLDKTTNKYKLATTKVDWTGWKLVSFDISGYELTDFDKMSSDNTVVDTAAQSTDNWSMILQTTWNKTEAKADTLFYLDSIFFYNDSEESAEIIGDYRNTTYSSTNKGTWIKGQNNDWKPASITGGYNGNPTAVQIDTNKTWTKSSTSKTFECASNNRIKWDDYGRNISNTQADSMYINFVMKQNSADSQTFSVYMGGKSNTTNSVYEKSGLTLNGTDWQIVSVKLSELDKVKGAAWDAGTVINDIGIYVPDFTTWNSKIGTEFLTSTTVFSIDSVWLSDYDMNAINAIPTVVNGATVSSAIDAVGFTFPMDLKLGKSVFDSDITVKIGESELADSEYTVQQEGNTLYVKFKNGLLPENDYTVSYAGGKPGAYMVANPATVSFRTSAAHYILDCSFAQNRENITTLPESGAVLAKAYLSNATAAATSARIIVAVYDKATGKLDSATMGDTVSVAIGKKAELSKIITLESYEGKKVKTFVFENGTLKPYGINGEIE